MCAGGSFRAPRKIVRGSARNRSAKYSSTAQRSMSRGSPVGEQRLQLGAEQERAVVQQRVVERLHAEPVAREEQRCAIRSHSANANMPRKRSHAGFAPLLPGVDDDLGVAVGAERMAGRLQLRNHDLVVVDLAVVDDSNTGRPR